MKYTISIDTGTRVIWIYKELDGGKMTRSFWNMTSFQPPLSDVLSKGKRYRGVVSYDVQNLPSGKPVKIPKTIKIGTKTYCNMI